MRLAMTGLMALGLTTFAAAPALAQPRIHVQLTPPGAAYVAPPPPAYVAPGPGYAYGPGGGAWQNPQVFTGRMNQRMDVMWSQLQDGVRRGAIHPRALERFSNRRQDIQRDLWRASRDGLITPGEREGIRNDVERLQRIQQRFHTGGAYGGGPRGWRY